MTWSDLGRDAQSSLGARAGDLALAWRWPPGAEQSRSLAHGHSAQVRESNRCKASKQAPVARPVVGRKLQRGGAVLREA